MKISRPARRIGRTAMVAVGMGMASVANPVGVLAASAAPKPPSGSVVKAVPTAGYGTILEVGGSGKLAGTPVYLLSSDTRSSFGCTTTPEVTYIGKVTCTGPGSDFGKVQSDEWPALTSAGRPVAGSGVRAGLLGTVHRSGIGNQVAYAGHPLYLFDPPFKPFVPAGENFLETVLPLPPWHGLWDLVSASTGQPAAGRATVETETLPSGKTALAAEMYPNAGIPGRVAVTVYTFSGRPDRAPAAARRPGYPCAPREPRRSPVAPSHRASVSAPLGTAATR